MAQTARNVLVVGTGLTSADIIASLDRQGYPGPITALSRRGQRSRGHAFGYAESPADFARDPACTALTLLRRIRQAVRRAQSERPLAFILWGAHAQKALAGLPRPQDLVIESAHPSPLSARRGFFGSRPFSRVNDWLGTQGEPPIDWALCETAPAA